MKEKAQYVGIDEKRYLCSVAVAAGMLVAIAGCEAPVTEREIYQKTHIPEHITNELFFNPYAVLPFKQTYPERWEVKIAQCPSGELPQQETVEKECKTNSVSLPNSTVVTKSLSWWLMYNYRAACDILPR
jgi:hypothetical protein